MTYKLIEASAHDTGLPDGSVHTVVTSPPYFGLRAYDGDQAIDWPAMEYAPMAGLDPVYVPAMSCGLGEEPDPVAFVGHLVLVMREMWRVLRDDGTAWVNLGDSFAGSGGAGGDYMEGGIRDGQPKFKPPKSSLKSKSKILIPHRFALAMQAEGWIVRQDIVWAKGVSCLPSYAGSSMPESVRDRPSTGHEYLFLLAKGPKYFYDADAVKEDSIHAGRQVTTTDGSFSSVSATANGKKPGGNAIVGSVVTVKPLRNLRSVWVINPGSYPGAHFATFPERLPELCILAGTSAKGVCGDCGAQWVRVVERVGEWRAQHERGGKHDGTIYRVNPGGGLAGKNVDRTSTTTGWSPSCDCDAGDPVPATVLDPFNGAGTSGKVAIKHNRNYIGVDLSAEYFEQTHERLNGTQPMLLIDGA